jgi:hypothetical protein
MRNEKTFNLATELIAVIKDNLFTSAFNGFVDFETFKVMENLNFKGSVIFEFLNGFIIFEFFNGFGKFEF